MKLNSKLLNYRAKTQICVNTIMYKYYIPPCIFLIINNVTDKMKMKVSKLFVLFITTIMF